MRGIIKFLIILMTISSLSTAYAAKTANITINVRTVTDYYLCIYGTGCLRIVPGKTYPFYHRVNLRGLFVLKDETRKVAPQASNSSCNVTVQRGQSAVISGYVGPRQHIRGLHCSVR